MVNPCVVALGLEHHIETWLGDITEVAKAAKSHTCATATVVALAEPRSSEARSGMAQMGFETYWLSMVGMNIPIHPNKRREKREMVEFTRLHQGAMTKGPKCPDRINCKVFLGLVDTLWFLMT